MVNSGVSTPDVEPLFANHFEILRMNTDIYLDIGIISPTDMAIAVNAATKDSESIPTVRFSVLQRIAMSPGTLIVLHQKLFSVSGYSVTTEEEPLLAHILHRIWAYGLTTNPCAAFFRSPTSGSAEVKCNGDDSIVFVVKSLDLIVTDDDQYETDEPRPSQETIQVARKLLRSMAEVGYNNLPKTYISVYYGEIAVTWKTEQNLDRLTFSPNGTIELYRQAD